MLSKVSKSLKFIFTYIIINSRIEGYCIKDNVTNCPFLPTCCLLLFNKLKSDEFQPGPRLILNQCLNILVGRAKILECKLYALGLLKHRPRAKAFYNCRQGSLYLEKKNANLLRYRGTFCSILSRSAHFLTASHT